MPQNVCVLGDAVAENRGTDFVAPLAPALCARTGARPDTAINIAISKD
jgi:hypothetical protein